jgi:hypothetical protein
MMDVCDFFRLHSTTTHAAIAYLDRLQPNETFTRFQWQMLAICCILISAKYNECEEHVPDFATLEDITQQTINNEIVLSHELWALKKMGWKLNVRTPMAFVTVYVHQGAFSDTKFSTYDLMEQRSESDEDNVVIQTIKTLASMATLDVRFKGIPASIVGSAILYMTRCELGVSDVWSDAMSDLTNHNEGDILDTIDLLREAALPLRGKTLPAQVEQEQCNYNSNSRDTMPDNVAIVDGESEDSDTEDDADNQAENAVVTPRKNLTVDIDNKVTPKEKIGAPAGWYTSPTSITDMEGALSDMNMGKCNSDDKFNQVHSRSEW